MFIVKIHQPGIDIKQIKQVNGSNEFCQEFFDDVPVPADNVVGEVNDGWTVASAPAVPRARRGRRRLALRQRRHRQAPARAGNRRAHRHGPRQRPVG